MKIIKFGGTSMGSAQAIHSAAQIIINAEKEDAIVVVVSAVSGITNLLLAFAQASKLNQTEAIDILNQIEIRHFTIIQELFPIAKQEAILGKVKVMLNDLEDIGISLNKLGISSSQVDDRIASYGELISSFLLSEYLTEVGLHAVAMDARQFIFTNIPLANEKIEIQWPETEEAVLYAMKHLPKKSVGIVTGFIASPLSKNSSYTITLGRGGSDFTAAILGAALRASAIEIWSDVDGMLTADPKMVPQAISLPYLTYEEAMELGNFGAKVIYPPTLQPAFNRSIPLYIKNTFNPLHPGTLVGFENSLGGESPIKGLSALQNMAILNVEGTGIVGVKGFSARLFHQLALRNVNVVMISQVSSEHSICIAIESSALKDAENAVNEAFHKEIQEGLVKELQIKDHVGIIALVGEKMQQRPGVAGKIFGTLGNNGINVIACAQGSSERNISVVVAEDDVVKAMQALHDAFFLTSLKTINVFLIGPGLIGATLLKQIAQQKEFLAAHKALHIKICGLINSKKQLIEIAGINAENAKIQLDASPKEAKLESFIESVLQLNLPNTLVIDCTAGAAIVPYYEAFLRKSITVVTPNKLANSGSQANYDLLHHLALRHNTQFLYETNAGAGLPVINTLKSLVASGDQILKVEGVLSGTLSYIFNTFGKDVPFYQAVRNAQDLGYTEPDPRDDLSGLDMARKMLILAREIGIKAELNDVKVQQILPDSASSATSVEAFYQALENENTYFEKLANIASEQHGKLRFIGKCENGSISISLEIVGPDSAFYSLNGSDNMIVYTTSRYSKTPLVVRGPGAGAEVTAAGIFADIISVA